MRQKSPEYQKNMTHKVNYAGLVEAHRNISNDHGTQLLHIRNGYVAVCSSRIPDSGSGLSLTLLFAFGTFSSCLFALFSLDMRGFS